MKAAVTDSTNESIISLLAFRFGFVHGKTMLYIFFQCFCSEGPSPLAVIFPKCKVGFEKQVILIFKRSLAWAVIFHPTESNTHLRRWGDGLAYSYDAHNCHYLMAPPRTE